MQRRAETKEWLDGWQFQIYDAALLASAGLRHDGARRAFGYESGGHFVRSGLVLLYPNDDDWLKTALFLFRGCSMARLFMMPQFHSQLRPDFDDFTPSPRHVVASFACIDLIACAPYDVAVCHRPRLFTIA